MQRIDIALNTHILKLQNHFKVLLNEEKITADIAYDAIVKNKQVIKILRDALETNDTTQRAILRDKLHILLKDKYVELKKRGVLQYHFIFPNNKVFLRFHKVSKFGDDLTNIRSDFRYVNETKNIVRGFAQGRTSHAFRNVYPLFDENKKHLGAVEISFSSEYLQDNFTNVANIHTHFLVSKNIFDTKAWERDDLVVQYSPSLEDDDYMISMPKSHTKAEYHELLKTKVKGLKQSIKKNISKHEPFALYNINNNAQEYADVISFLPIKNNITQEILAWIVSYEKDEFIKVTVNNTNYIRVILFIGLLMLFYFIYKTLYQQHKLEQAINLKTAELKELNENLEQRIVFEVAKSKDIEAKLFQSDKMVSMGEMIGNIAHQWRQPLSAISTGATGIIVKKEYGILSDDDLIASCNNINKHAQYLSQTIDDFRNYIKGDRDKKVFTLKSDIDSFLHLIEGSSKKEVINIIVNVDEKITIDGYPNELVQCFINIYNNAKDAFNDYHTEKKYIFISCESFRGQIKIHIKDNAGGIPEEIIHKIFEPYFTTKHKTQGTGLGLHMTYTLIVEGMAGNIEVHNRTYDYEQKIYTGAEFIITLPQ
ncbi:MAG: ATP-binding protein [Arcobacteraceae bacterium]